MPSLRSRLVLLAASVLASGCVEITLPSARPPRDAPTAPVETAPFAADRDETSGPRSSAAEGGPFKNRLALSLSPSRSAGPRVDRLDVTMAFSGEVSAAGEPLVLTLRDVDLGETGWASRIEQLAAEDERGPLPLRRDDAPWAPSGVPRAVWRSDRPRIGDVTVHYRVSVPKPRESQSNFGLYGDAVGLGGPARTFLLLPPASGSFRVSLRWGLGGLSRGASGACRHGEGDVVFSTTLPDLSREIVMAGPLTTTTLPDGDGTLRAVWLGRPAFDPARLLPLIARVRREATRAFGVSSPRPLVLVRTQEGAPGGAGEADDDALTLLFAPSSRFTPDTRLTIAHEAIHAWIGHALRVAGEPDATWFTEGFTVHYSRKLLARTGDLSPDELLGELHRHGVLYAQMTLGLAPGASLAMPRTGASAPSVLPYAHGSFYAAELEAGLRAREGSAVSLDAFLRDLFASGPTPVPLARFRDRVQATLGDAGAQRFDAVIGEGLPADPPSDAFGPCFRRVAAPKALRSGVPLLVWERTPSCRAR